MIFHLTEKKGIEKIPVDDFNSSWTEKKNINYSLFW